MTCPAFFAEEEAEVVEDRSEVRRRKGKGVLRSTASKRKGLVYELSPAYRSD